MSRRTLNLLLAALLVALGLAAWAMPRQDVCSAHLAGLRGPATQIVSQGRHAVEIPCEVWFPRQPIAAQSVCLVAVTLGLAGLVSFGIDLVRWRRPVRSSSERSSSG